MNVSNFAPSFSTIALYSVALDSDKTFLLISPNFYFPISSFKPWTATFFIINFYYQKSILLNQKFTNSKSNLSKTWGGRQLNLRTADCLSVLVSFKKKEVLLYILVKDMNSSHKDQFFKEILILFFFRLTYARVSDVFKFNCLLPQVEKFVVWPSMACMILKLYKFSALPYQNYDTVLSKRRTDICLDFYMLPTFI